MRKKRFNTWCEWSRRKLFGPLFNKNKYKVIGVSRKNAAYLIILSLV